MQVVSWFAVGPVCEGFPGPLFQKAIAGVTARLHSVRKKTLSRIESHLASAQGGPAVVAGRFSKGFFCARENTLKNDVIPQRKFGKKFRSKIYEKTKYCCFYCGKSLSEKTWSIDHIVPLYKGGSDEIENLIGACLACNKRKKHHSIEEFRVLQSRLNQKIPWFYPEQKSFLEMNGFKAHIPELELFWWEKMND